MYYLSDICSLCLAREQNLKSILSSDTDGTVVAEKIRIFLIEIIHFKPHIHKYICNKCLESLNYIHKFREKCLENILKLNEYVQKLDQQESCKNYAVHNSSDTSVRVTKYNINTGLDDTPYLNSLNSSVDLWHFCLPRTRALPSLPLLIGIQENEIQSIFIKEEPADYDESTDYTVENDHELETVLKIEIEETQNSLLEVEDPFIDLQTQYEVFTKLNEEKQTTTSTLKPTTSINTSNSLKKRKQNSTKDRKYKCSECQKSFKIPSDLERHYSVHSTERPYSCQICHKSFKQRGALSMHMHAHTGEKPYGCDVCDKAFSQKINLIIHKRIHSNVKPFICSECSKAFTTNSNLTVHMRSHTGEKPFQCLMCTYKTVTSTKLTLHMKRHGKRISC